VSREIIKLFYGDRLTPQVYAKSSSRLTLRVATDVNLADDVSVLCGEFEVLGPNGLLSALPFSADVELWRCGFHPHPDFRSQHLTYTNEYALDGAFVRRLATLRCMRGGHIAFV
jgi:hypothetical protein